MELLDLYLFVDVYQNLMKNLCYLRIAKIPTGMEAVTMAQVVAETGIIRRAGAVIKEAVDTPVNGATKAGIRTKVTGHGVKDSGVNRAHGVNKAGDSRYVCHITAESETRISESYLNLV